MEAKIKGKKGAHGSVTPTSDTYRGLVSFSDES